MPDTIDAADHTGLVYHVMKVARVRERFQPADADDIEGHLFVTLVRCAQLYKPDGGATFAHYAIRSMMPIAQAACRKRVLRKKSGFRRDGEFVRRREILFSEIGPRFDKDSRYFATVPPAEHDLEAAEDRRHAADELDRVLEHDPRDTPLPRNNWVRQRQILLDRFGHGECEPMTLAQVGHKWGISRERVRQTESGVLLALRRKHAPS